MKDYPYIRAWGRFTGSRSYYIEEQVDKARETKAPQNAIYYDANRKRWHTVEEIALTENRQEIEAIVKVIQYEND
jgi:hypothetical protein